MRWWLPTVGGEPALNLILGTDAKPGTPSSPVRFLLDQIHCLTARLKESEADRAARLELIHTLTAALKESEVDLAERLATCALAIWCRCRAVAI